MKKEKKDEGILFPNNIVFDDICHFMIFVVV